MESNGKSVAMDGSPLPFQVGSNSSSMLATIERSSCIETTTTTVILDNNWCCDIDYSGIYSLFSSLLSVLSPHPYFHGGGKEIPF